MVCLLDHSGTPLNEFQLDVTYETEHNRTWVCSCKSLRDFHYSHRTVVPLGAPCGRAGAVASSRLQGRLASAYAKRRTDSKLSRGVRYSPRWRMANFAAVHTHRITV